MPSRPPPPPVPPMALPEQHAEEPVGVSPDFVHCATHLPAVQSKPTPHGTVLQSPPSSVTGAPHAHVPPPTRMFVHSHRGAQSFRCTQYPPVLGPPPDGTLPGAPQALTPVCPAQAALHVSAPSSQQPGAVQAEDVNVEPSAHAHA